MTAREIAMSRGPTLPPGASMCGGHCQVNPNPLFFDAKSTRANTTNQRPRLHVDQWNLQEIS